MYASMIKFIQNTLNKSEKHLQSYIEFILKEYKELDSWSSSIFYLYRGLLMKTDDVLLLLKHEHYASIPTLVRVIFENYLYLKYILERNGKWSKDRGKAHYLYGVLEQYKFYNNLKDGKIELESINIDINEIERMLSQDGKKNIEYEQERLKKNYIDLLCVEKYSNRLMWYSWKNRINNVKDLSIKLDESDYYNTFYTSQSLDVHSRYNKNILQIEIIDNQMGILSQDTDVAAELMYVFKFLTESTKEILKLIGDTDGLKQYNSYLKINYKLNYSKLNFRSLFK